MCSCCSNQTNASRSFGTENRWPEFCRFVSLICLQWAIRMNYIINEFTRALSLLLLWFIFINQNSFKMHSNVHGTFIEWRIVITYCLWDQTKVGRSRDRPPNESAHNASQVSVNAIRSIATSGMCEWLRTSQSVSH